VSPGWVSAVRQGLVARDWVESQRKGLIVSKPKEILRAWAAADRWEDRTTVLEYSSVLPKTEVVTELPRLMGERRCAFTQWTAAEHRRPATESDIVTLYVENPPDERILLETLLARRVERHGNIHLVVPKDNGIFLGQQTIDGIPLVCDAQIWLDLLRAGNRGAEQAEALWAWVGFGGWSG